MHNVADGKPLAQRYTRVEISGIRAMRTAARALQAQGEPIIHLEVGEPDFDTPEHIKAAAVDGLAKGMVHYVPGEGIPELREAVARHYSERGLDTNASNVLVTTGATEAIYLTLSSLLDTEDEVMVLTPSWMNYVTVPTILGVRTHLVPMREDNGFRPDVADMQKALTPATRLLVLCNPNNPTGSVMSEADQAALAEFVVKNNLLVLSDEIYEHIRFDGKSNRPLATFPGMRDRTITISGASKTYAMTGWRVGWLIAPSAIMTSLAKGRQYGTGSGTGFVQIAAAAALTGDQSCVHTMVAEFSRRGKRLAEGLNAIDGFRVDIPDGAFYVYANIEALGKSDHELALYLLHQAKVACVPGSVFGPGFEGYLRFSCASAYEDIEEALPRIAQAVRELTSAK